VLFKELVGLKQKLVQECW